MKTGERPFSTSRILAYGLVGGSILLILFFKIPPLRDRLAANEAMITDFSNQIEAQEILRIPYTAMNEELRTHSSRIYAHVADAGTPGASAPPARNMAKWVSETAGKSGFRVEPEQVRMDTGSATPAMERVILVIRGRGELPLLIDFLELLCAPSFSRGIDHLEILPASDGEVTASIRLVTWPAEAGTPRQPLSPPKD